MDAIDDSWSYMLYTYKLLRIETATSLSVGCQLVWSTLREKSSESGSVLPLALAPPLAICCVIMCIGIEWRRGARGVGDMQRSLRP